MVELGQAITPPKWPTMWGGNCSGVGKCLEIFRERGAVVIKLLVFPAGIV